MAPLLPSLVAHARDILSSAIDSRNEPVASTLDVPTPNHSIISRLGPLAARSILLARDGEGETGYKNNPHEGATNFRDINNTGVFVVFGLIGVTFVVGGIWFFFWAKNGGFYFKENDWDDYKSTVLRRKGPNGTILSGATPSTQLGGGSAYKDYDANTEYTGGLTQVSGGTDDTQSTLTGITGGVSDIMGRARRKAKRERKEREREKKKDRRSREKAAHRGEDGVLVDEEAEAEAQSHLRAYRGEKPARVGGINKESEGSQWDGSTNPSHSAFSADSDLLSNRQETPTRSDKKKRRREDRHRDRDQEKEAYYRDDQTTYTDAETTTTATAPTRDRSRSKSKARDREASSAAAGSSKKAGGIRKVYSTAQRNTDREEERMRAEARHLATDKSRSAGRRDFSYQRAESYHRHNRSDGAGRAATIVEEEGDIGMLGGGRYLPAPGGESEVGGGGYENNNSADYDNGNKKAQDDDLGTKTYHCYIPGLSSSAGGSSVVGTEVSSSSYQEEKRKKRAAGRNRRGDD
ncbi:hypothetical protein DL762_005585 [Monosporascus cannonballus]|uniref:Endosomal spry domain-containing protein n=1 Tax=Monosporascus cannonballus TaxID=155416 RepID=A0ABY0H4G3_9PEZI|nr:hypothetical protein DL762_005585 [Monosporascus cannonballus]RYP00145.1 hypothetical protein DL763_001074 [Monosporascus cannonballus]